MEGQGIDVKVYEALVKEKQALVEVVGSQDAQLEAYKKIGTPEEITEAIDKSLKIAENLEGVDIPTVKSCMEELTSYRNLGTVDELNQAIDQSVSIIESYLALGSPLEIDKAIVESKSLIEKFTAQGTVESVVAMKEEINTYHELGTIDEINKAMDILEEKVTETKCEQIAAKYNTDAATVHKMYEKVSDFKIVDELLNEGFASRVKTKKPEDDNKTRLGINESIVTRITKQLM